VAAGAKKSGKLFVAFILKYPTDHSWAVVQSGVVEEVKDRVTTTFGIGETINHRGITGKYDSTGTHGAWLLGNIEDGVIEAPVAGSRGGLSDSYHLGVCCRVFKEFGLIVGTPQQFG
jgi:hypothetical protein